MRGGTVLHKVHLAPAARYSQDIDLVAVGERPEEHIRKALMPKQLSFGRTSVLKRSNSTNATEIRSSGSRCRHSEVNGPPVICHLQGDSFA